MKGICSLLSHGQAEQHLHICPEPHPALEMKDFHLSDSQKEKKPRVYKAKLLVVFYFPDLTRKRCNSTELWPEGDLLLTPAGFGPGPLSRLIIHPWLKNIMTYKSGSVQGISGSEQLCLPCSKCTRCVLKLAGCFPWDLWSPTAPPWGAVQCWWPQQLFRESWEGPALLENLSVQRLNVCLEMHHSDHFTKCQNSK